MTLDKNVDTLDDLQFELNDNSSDEYMDIYDDEILSRFIYKPQELNAITLLNRLKIRLDPLMIKTAEEYLRILKLNLFENLLLKAEAKV